MSNLDHSYSAIANARPVINLDVDARGAFIARTYAHLFGAILAFTLIEVVLFQTGAAEKLANAMLGTSWLVVLGGFMVVSWFATRSAMTSRSLPAQYMALGAFVLAEALIFVPLLWMAFTYAPGAIQSAAGVTLAGFTGLTAIAMWTRKDFSFLGSILRWAGLCAIGLIVTSVIFGWNMGTWFSVGMVVFAGAAILYDTSNVLRRFPEDRYVGAALQLFASVALMFWYVLRIFLGNRD